MKQKTTLALAVSVFLYIAVFAVLTYWKLAHFHYDNLDLAIFNNVFFNTLQGEWFRATINPPSYLGDHFSPFLLLLVPLYALQPGPFILLTMETIVIGLTALPIYLIAKKILGNEKRWLAYGVGLLWLLNPLVHNMNFYEFELTPFAVFLMFWVIYSYQKYQKPWFFVFFLLALSVREDVALVLLFVSALAWIDRRSLFWKLSPIVLAVVYSIISFSVIDQYSVSGAYKFLAFYSWLGGTTLPSVIGSFLAHPLELVKHQLTMKNLEFVLGLVFPFFFLVIRRSKYLVLLIAPLAQIWLAEQGGSAIILMTHHSGYFLFALFLVCIDSLDAIEHGRWPRFIPLPLRKKSFLYAVIIAATVYGSSTYGSIAPTVLAWNDDNQRDAKRALVEIVPDGASVAATYELMSPLSTRRDLSAFHYAALGKGQYALADLALPPATEYLAIDWQDVLKMQMHFYKHHVFGAFADDVPERILTMLENYRLVQASGSVTLWHYATDLGQNESLAALTSFPDSEAKSVAVTDPEILVADQQGDMLRITIGLPENPEPEQKYYLTIDTSQREFLLPIGYGILTPSSWAGHPTLEMNSYLESGERAENVTLYKWQNGFLTLGDLKDLAMESDAALIGEYPIR
ncbi:MAG: DUF2079 domain-containing protein [Patescibacteria group bacterium]